MSPPAQVLSAHAFVARNDAASPSLPVLDQTTDAATPFYSVPATSPRLRRGDADADADGRPMILRRLHVRVSRLSLASAALLDVAPRALPSAGLFRARGLHGAAGDDGASSEHGRKPAGTSSSSSSSLLIDSSVAALLIGFRISHEAAFHGIQICHCCLFMRALQLCSSQLRSKLTSPVKV